MMLGRLPCRLNSGVVRRAVGGAVPGTTTVIDSSTCASFAPPRLSSSPQYNSAAAAAAVFIATRSFHNSKYVEKRKIKPVEPDAYDDSKDPEIQQINADDMTEDEMWQVLDQAEAEEQQEYETRFNLDYEHNKGMRRRKIQVTIDYDKILMEEGRKARPWSLRDWRCGALAIKVGMMPIWDKWGERHPTTVLFVEKNIVMGHKTTDKHGYMAIQVAAGERKRKNVGGTVLGQYKAILDENVNPPYLVREFRITDEAHFLPIGSQIHARHFVPGQNIDISGITKGKGFQGAMKRWGFGGLPASHGVSKSHRSLGATGQCQDPGKVFKGKKMAGQMGGDRVTIQSQRILKIDRGRNLLFIKGHVPGNKGQFVELRDAIKKPLWRTNKVLGALEQPPVPTFEFDSAVDGTGLAGFDEWMPLSEIDPLNFHYDPIDGEKMNLDRAHVGP